MVATMSFRQVLFSILSLGSFVLAQNTTSSRIYSFSVSNLTTSKTIAAPSTVLITSTPGGGIETATTIITSGYQNTTQSSAFETPDPISTTPTFQTPIFTSAVNTPNSPATSTPTLLSAASSIKFNVLPIMGAVMAFLVGMCVCQ